MNLDFDPRAIQGKREKRPEKSHLSQKKHRKLVTVPIEAIRKSNVDPAWVEQLEKKANFLYRMLTRGGGPWDDLLKSPENPFHTVKKEWQDPSLPEDLNP